MPETLYLIDGHALAYRMYFALMGVGGGRFTTRSGEPTAGTYGFFNTIMRLLEREKPEYLAVAFDVGKTFRDDIFPEYKGTREKMPDDLREQIERIKEIVDAFGFPRLEMEGYEADDVLGSVAQYAVEEGLGVKIITGDKDLLQLVKDRIIVNLPARKGGDTVDYDAQGVLDYWGIRPDQVVVYKALAGDSSDNIPGVPGVGDKTAKMLLETYQDLDDIYDHIEDIPSRYQKKLVAGKESAYMSYDLARIRTNVKISIDLNEAKTKRINFSEVAKLFQQLEFRSLVNRLLKLEYELTGSNTPPPGPSGQMSLFGGSSSITDRIGESVGPDIETIIVDKNVKLSEMVAAIEKAEHISFDTETSSTNPITADLVGISLAVNEKAGYYIPVGHQSGNQLSLDQVIDALKPAFTNEDIKKIGHNLKYDYIMLKRNGIDTAPMSFDTMIAQFLIDPTSRRLGLKDMAENYLGIEMTKIEALIGKGKEQISMADVAIEKAAPYAAADAVIPLKLMKLLKPRMEEINATKVFAEVEMPLVSVLAAMELDGIKLDVDFLQSLEGELAKRQAELATSIYNSVGHEFNLNSTQQLSDVLFEELGITPPPRTKKTKSGKYSTSASVLEKLHGKHPVADWILEYRELTKLTSTYINSLPEEVNPATGRVHSSFNQTVAITGRLASSNPNLQNIPTRTEQGKRIRRAFVAEEGKVLMAVDYSQVELRIVAHLAQDETMLKAFQAGLDIHAATAAAIYHVDLNDVSKDQRRHAKAINFGLIYGMGAYGLSQSTGLTVGEADEFIQVYFKQFPGVKAFLDQVRVDAAKNGYVKTLYGRRRYFPNLQNPANTAQKRREEREAINSPIQGTAADIMKVAMIGLYPALEKAGLHGRLLLQIHDELMVECPETEVPQTLDLIREVMENAIRLSIPLSTEAKVGANWAEMKVVERP